MGAAALATIPLYGLTIRTNGKPDASALVDAVRYAPDQVTQLTAGAIPLMLHPAPRTVANIGLGSGITGATILGDPRVEHLDTIEIEPKVVDLARHFERFNRRVYDDPRSSIHIEDAKSFFASAGRTYDVIVSEPSNPWVSGVAGLFSVEFYRHVSRYLAKGGLYAQWLQTYEMDPDRASSVLKAVGEALDDYLVLAQVEGDTLIVASPHGAIRMPEDGYARLSAATRQELRRIDVSNQADITLRVIGNKAMLAPWLNARKVRANSDFVPYLDSHADKDRFLGQAWPESFDVALSAFPIAEVLGGRPALPTQSALSITSHFGMQPAWLPARLVKEALTGPPTGSDWKPVPTNLPPELANLGREILARCDCLPPEDSGASARTLSAMVLPYLSPTEGRKVLAALERASCLQNLRGTPQAGWRRSLSGVTDRKASEFGAAADELLMNPPGTAHVHTRYVLGMAMLGRVAARDRAGARELWSRYSLQVLGNKPADLALEIILAHAQRPDAPTDSLRH
jgi:spermidine synthase